MSPQQISFPLYCNYWHEWQHLVDGAESISIKRSEIQYNVRIVTHTDIIARIFGVYNYQNKDLRDAFKHWFSLSASSNLPWISSSPPFNSFSTTVQYWSPNAATSCANIWICHENPNNADITVNHPPFGQAHSYWHIPSPWIHQIKAFFLNIG